MAQLAVVAVTFLAGAAPAISFLLLVGLALQLQSSQAQSEQALIDRFRIRAEIGSQFLTGYTKDLLTRERLEASAELGGPVSVRQFTRFSRALGFPAAILLDDAGRVLAVEPPSAELLGRNASASYEHLAAALKGHAAVSNVVASAARSIPVVGFAVSIETDHGRRVFSGALSIATTTLGSSYLKTILPHSNARVYLVDENAATIASSLAGPQTADLMQQQDLPLSKAIANANEGRYEGSTEAERFAVARVEATPWRLVVSVPERELLAPLAGHRRWISWVIFGALCLAAVAVTFLSRRLASSRAAQLAAIEQASLTDALTGLYNRRGHEILSAHVLRSAAREKKTVAVFFLDLDGLKRVNDEQGHDAGDRMLLRAADFFRIFFRDADVIARLGGDEFCVVGAVPGTTGDGENVRHRLTENLARHNATSANDPPLSVSMGVTWWNPRDPRPLEDLVNEADGRMYEDKRNKRTRAQSAGTCNGVTASCVARSD